MTLDAAAEDYTKLQDKIVSEASKTLSFGVMQYIPCKLYINGEYWGFYNITEKYDDRYLEYYYGVDKKNVILIKDGEVEEGKASDLDLYLDAVSFVETKDMSVESNYEQACLIFDMDSFIDYFAVQTYINNSADDWPNTNIALWRTKSITDQPNQDGKWRWLLFDLNGKVLLDNDYVEVDTVDYLLSNSKMFRNLWSQPIFKERFLNRLGQLATVFDAQALSDYIDSFVLQYIQELNNSYNRFLVIDPGEIMTKIMNIKQFFVNRSSIIDSLIQRYRYK